MPWRADVWTCRFLGRGVPMSGARRADVCASWGHQLVPAGANLVPMSSGWYPLVLAGTSWVPAATQLVPAGTSWVPAGTQLVPADNSWYQLELPRTRLAPAGTSWHPQDAQTSARHAQDIGTPRPRHRHAMPQTCRHRHAVAITMVPYHDNMVARGHGTYVPWSHFTMVSWSHGTMALL